MYEALHDKVPGSIPDRRLKFRSEINSEAPCVCLPDEEPGPGKGEVGGVVEGGLRLV